MTIIKSVLVRCSKGCQSCAGENGVELKHLLLIVYRFQLDFLNKKPFRFGRVDFHFGRACRRDAESARGAARAVRRCGTENFASVYIWLKERRNILRLYNPYSSIFR
jgi:hypothetical protein